MAYLIFITFTSSFFFKWAMFQECGEREKLDNHTNCDNVHWLFDTKKMFSLRCDKSRLSCD